MRVSLARRLVRPEATRCVRPRTLPAAAALRWAHGAADSPLPCAAVAPEEYERQLPPGLVAHTPSPALFVFICATADYPSPSTQPGLILTADQDAWYDDEIQIGISGNSLPRSSSSARLHRFAL